MNENNFPLPDRVLLEVAEKVKARLIVSTGYREVYSERFNEYQKKIDAGYVPADRGPVSVLQQFTQVMTEYHAAQAAAGAAALQCIFDLCTPAARAEIMKGLP